MPTDDAKLCSTNGESPAKVVAEQTEPVGQHKAYVILCDAERKQGFVKPYRDSYRHVGPRGPTFALRDLDSDEHERYDEYGYVKFEEYPKDPAKYGSSVGRFWTQAQLDGVRKGCGSVTTMGRKIAETYARDPRFYGATFCVRCNVHKPLAEFAWEPDGEPMDPREQESPAPPRAPQEGTKP